jgi:PAS domain S-box-containing protein
LYQQNISEVNNLFRKITELFHTDKNFKSSETIFQAVAKTATDSIIIADQDSTIVFINKKAQETFGYTEEEMLGQKLSILMPEKYRESHYKGVQRFLTTGVPKLIGQVVEIEGLKKNGTSFPLELSLSFWKQKDKIFFSGIIRDISERKKNLQEIYLFQNITEAISEVKSYKEALKITIQKVCEATEWSYGEAWLPKKDKEHLVYAPVSYVSDKCLVEFVEESKKLILNVNEGMPGRVFQGNIEWVPDTTVGEGTHLRRALAKKVGLKASLGVPIVADGEVLAAMIFYMFEPKKQDFHLTGIVASIAKQLGTVLNKKKAEEALKEINLLLEKKVLQRTEELVKKNEELEAKNKELQKIHNDIDSFIYRASHDLKAPMSNIEGLINSLQDSFGKETSEKEEVKKMIGMVNQSIRSFQNTINDLTDIARIQRNIEEDSVYVNLLNVMEEVILSINKIIADTGTHLHINITCTEIYFSRSNLKSIIYNLLTNAIKFRSPDRSPEIHLSCIETEGYHVLSVKDNGLGLDLTKHKLFTMFRRFHGHVEGSGIGLYIVKRIVDNAGGKIEVESETGKGSTFKVYFKKQPSPAP